MSFDFKADSHWDAYPAGLKVLAVDDDPLCLKVVAEMLKRCNYEVITAENGKEALLTLRDKSSQIDLVLSDVYMPDMDGFKLLETVGLELDLPVIMMSSNGDTPVVLRGVTHGAVDFLIKPVRIEELRNVWQHVVRRRRDQAQTSREYSGDDEVVDGNRADKKRKESPTQVQREGEDNASTKKPRVVWSVEMHQQFVNAVNSLGIDKAVPKRILDQMQVDGLTRENVASHLQKYRLYLKRVAGVQVQASGRGKGSRNAGGDSHTSFPPMILPGHGMGGAQGLSMGSPMGSLSDQEQLKLQLQMQQMRNQQAIGAQPPYCKQEGPMLATGVVPPYSAGNGLANGLPGPDYSQLRPTGSYCNGGAPSRPAGAPGLMAMRSGSYDNGALGLPHQAYDAAGIAPLTSNDLMYPDHQLMHQQQHHSSLGGLRDLNLSQDLHHTGSLHQPTDLGSADNLANGHTEQDMEKFINIFLQPND